MKLTIFAVGVTVGVIIALKLIWTKEPSAPAYRESDDGIQVDDFWATRTMPDGTQVTWSST